MALDVVRHALKRNHAQDVSHRTTYSIDILRRPITDRYDFTLSNNTAMRLMFELDGEWQDTVVETQWKLVNIRIREVGHGIPYKSEDEGIPSTGDWQDVQAFDLRTNNVVRKIPSNQPQ